MLFHPGAGRQKEGMSFRFLDHTADIGVEVEGATLADLFRQGAAALLSLLTDHAAVTTSIAREIHIEGADPTDLWINYLREILYLFNGEGFFVREVGELTFAPSAAGAAGFLLTAHCSGEIYDPRRHLLATEVKAVTYHHAEVTETPGGWRGVFIVDV